MIRIHVNRDRQNLGQFSPEEVADGLASGRFLPSDLAWRDGMETWQPLATFTDLPAPGEILAPVLAPGSEEVPSPVVTGPAEPAWERREEIGYVAGLLGTIRQVVTNPLVTFRRMKKTGGLLEPFLFFYLMQIGCGLVGVFESLVWVRVLPPHLISHLGEDPAAAVTGNLIVTVPMMFFMGFVLPFVASGIYYVAGRLLVKKPVDFETIFRAYCYLAGSLAVLNLVPMPPIVFVQITYTLFLVIVVLSYQVLAIREALDLTTAEAAGIVLLPLLVCCFCIFASVSVVAALGGASMLQNMGR